MCSRVILFFLLASATSVNSCIAHDGHGHSPDQGQTLFHYLSEPYHLLQILIVALIGITIGYLLGYRSHALRNR